MGTAIVEPELPQGLMGDNDAVKHHVCCLAKRLVTKEGSQVEQWLIQWTEDSSEDSTWEDAINFQTQFPPLSSRGQACTSRGEY